MQRQSELLQKARRSLPRLHNRRRTHPPLGTTIGSVHDKATALALTASPLSAENF